MEVEIKDRDRGVEYLRMALNACEIGVSYIQADLIEKVFNEVGNLGGSFDLQDAARILNEHKSKWNKYFEEKNNLKLSTK